MVNNRGYCLNFLNNQLSANLKYIIDESGNSFARIGNRTADYAGLDHNIAVNEQTKNSDIEISYKMRQDSDKQYQSTGTLVVSHGSGTSYIICVSSCHVANDDWLTVGGRCNIALDNLENIDLNTISSIRLSIHGKGSEFGVSLPNIYIDDVSVKIYERDLSWVPAADQRIDFFRKIGVYFDVQAPSAAKIEVKMTKNHFPFGATFHQQMPDEMSDYKSWFDIFNFGVARNAYKWKQQEISPGVYDWSKSDAINDIFYEQQTPLRGHTLFWSVDKNVQQWLHDVAESGNMTALHDYTMKRVDDIVFRYLGNITDWDLFNEVHHGDFFRTHLGIEIWTEVLDRLDTIAPQTGKVMNDYELTRADHGSCFLDLINPIVERLDAVGLQSHFKKIPNNQVLNRLNVMAGKNLENRLLVTELDVDNADVDVRATDIGDVIKVMYSHPNVDGIILWGWLQAGF